MEATWAEQAARVRRGESKGADLVDRALQAIESQDAVLNAFITVSSEDARSRAEAVDRAVAGGRDPGPLAGVPVAVKDNFCTRAMPTTCGSRILESFVPLYDATVVRKLEQAGAVVVGKTNMDEFAMGSSNENSAFGPVRNPWDTGRVPGGSSGGSAVAVASGMSGLSVGSDTGGSIRQPASFCGVYGLKPTYGRVSRFGLVAFASSLDQPGGFARDVESLSLLYRIMAGSDPRDATSVPVDIQSSTELPRRIGVAESLLGRAGVQSEVAEAVRAAAGGLQTEGARIRAVELPDPDLAMAAYYLLATAEASSNLARYDGVRMGLRVPGATLTDMYANTRSSGFGTEVQRRILLGTFTLSAGYVDAFYRKARQARMRLSAAFQALFQDVDLIVLPISPETAFPLGERVDDPVKMYLADLFTVFANLTGAPGLSVPWGEDASGLPVGVQLLAPPWKEHRLFAAAAVLERLRGPLPRPPVVES